MISADAFTNSLKKPISIRNLVKQGSLFLDSYDISNSKNEIEWYIQYLYQCDKSKFYQIIDNDFEESLLDNIQNFLIKRSKKTPFQHIIGRASFYGRDYIVNPDVLIPRPESELLIDIIKNKKYKKMLDIGTGTGCLGITALLENIVDSVDAVDISRKALDVAKKNQQILNVDNINFYNLDILNNLPSTQYDIIISNPPYISQAEYYELDGTVKNNEPKNALTDLDNGYTFYIRYASIFQKILEYRGVAVIEISHLFCKDNLKDIFKEFSSITFHKDLNDDYRAISIIK